MPHPWFYTAQHRPDPKCAIWSEQVGKSMQVKYGANLDVFVFFFSPCPCLPTFSLLKKVNKRSSYITFSLDSYLKHGKVGGRCLLERGLHNEGQVCLHSSWALYSRLRCKNIIFHLWDFHQHFISSDCMNITKGWGVRGGKIIFLPGVIDTLPLQQLTIGTLCGTELKHGRKLSCNQTLSPWIFAFIF